MLVKILHGAYLEEIQKMYNDKIYSRQNFKMEQCTIYLRDFTSIS